MKVLEKGPGWSIEQLCTGKGNGNGGCKSRLLIEKGDIYLTSHTDMVGDTDYFCTFKCPVCGIETDIKESDVPSSIRRELLDNRRCSYTRSREYREWR